MVGTAAYMAPEQAEGLEAGAPADLYSLALVIYEGLTGVNPVRAGLGAQRARRLGAHLPPLRRQRRDLPRELGQGIDLALRPRPRERGGLGDLRLAMMASVEQLEDSPGVVQGPRPRPWLRRRRAAEPAPALGFPDPTPPTAPTARDLRDERNYRDRGGLGAPVEDHPDAAPELDSELPAWPARGLAAAGAAFVAAWLFSHAITPSILGPTAAALIAGLAVAALPCLGWLLLTFAVTMLLLAGGRPGAALVIAPAALLPVFLDAAPTGGLAAGGGRPGAVAAGPRRRMARDRRAGGHALATGNAGGDRMDLAGGCLRDRRLGPVRAPARGYARGVGVDALAARGGRARAGGAAERRMAAGRGALGACGSRAARTNRTPVAGGRRGAGDRLVSDAGVRYRYSPCSQSPSRRRYARHGGARRSFWRGRRASAGSRQTLAQQPSRSLTCVAWNGALGQAMSVLRSLENKIAGLVEGTFSRAFRSEVRPVEIARKLAREMEEHKSFSVSRTYVPNEYRVFLSPRDRERFADYESALAEELAGYLLEHARRERLAMLSRPVVEFETDERLGLGRVRDPDRRRAAPGRVRASPIRPGQVEQSGRTMVYSSAERVAEPLEENARGSRSAGAAHRRRQADGGGPGRGHDRPQPRSLTWCSTTPTSRASTPRSAPAAAPGC